MLTVSGPIRSIILAVSSLCAFNRPRTLGRLTVQCLALALAICGVVQAASAQTKTATAATLAVTSGGSAATTVASGSVVTLTASVNAGTTPVTPGQVNFCDASAIQCTDIHLLGTAQLIQSGPNAGTAVLKFRPGAGSHSYKAVFQGTNTYAGSSSSQSALTVTGGASSLNPTTTTITQGGYAGNYTLTATVAGQGPVAPTGTVSFLDTSNGNALLRNAALGAGQITLSWLNPQSPTSSIGSESIVVGDFNGDGIPDLVVGGPSTNDSTPTVNLMLGNGDGTFTTSTLFPTQLFYTSSIAVGDFNGDGKADLAVLGYGSLYILLGNGDGTFNISAPSGYSSGFVAVGDFNGDGIQDLAVLCQTGSKNIVYILLGNGDGTFTPVAGSLTVGEVIGSIAVGDFNGDGKADLAVTNQIDNSISYGGSSVSILLGNGDGTFTAAPTIENPPTQPRSVVIGDFNGDGIQDLAVAGYSTQIFLGNGNGTFKPSTILYASGSSITVGDFNGDGKADLAMVWPDYYTASVFLGNGDATFTQGTSPSTGNFPWAIAAGDLNGDGFSDLAVANAGGDTVTVLTSQYAQTATATVTGIAPTGAGPHLVDASYPGDSNYASSTSATTALVALAATPVISPTPGTYTTTTSQTITITDTTPGATIYYSASGTVSTSGYVAYTGPITVPPSASGYEYISAYAAATGYSQSSYVYGYFTITLPSAATPVITPVSGTYTSAQTVTITDTTPGAAIYYSASGIVSTSGYVPYTGPISVPASANGYENISVYATAAGYSQSSYAYTYYTLNLPPVATPVISPATGNFTSNQTVTITDSTPGATIYYAMSGTDQTNGYVQYTGPIIIPTSAQGFENISAYAVATGFSQSSYTSVYYQFTLPPAATPVITPATGTYGSAQSITITDSTPGATIYYEGQGTLNTNGFIPYIGPITLSAEGYENIQAYATATGYSQSPGAIANYTLLLPPTTTPVISAASGTYASAQTVTITDSAPGAAIFYTTNGSLPTASSTPYTGPITVSASETVGAVAIASGYSTSAPASAQYIIDSSSASLIYSIVGDGVAGYSGDGGPATAADLNYPYATAQDSAGNLYIADSDNNVIRKVAAGTGVIATVAGTGTAGYSGDGKPATSAQLNFPESIALDSAGNLYIADTDNNVIRMVSATTGIITTFAGSGVGNCGGDNGPAAGAGLDYPMGIAFDGAGNLYVANPFCGRVQMIAASTSRITTVAGNGQYGYGGDNGPATSAVLYEPWGIALDSAGNLYIADTYNNIVRKVNAKTGVITTVAGTPPANSYGYPGKYSGDGGPATGAWLYYPAGVAVDSAGNIYIADTWNQAIRKVTAISGAITTVVGGGPGSWCYALGGDGGPATSAELCMPQGVSVDSTGNLFIADSSDNRIREATVSGPPPVTTAAAPVFSVSEGTYVGSQTVTITDSTPGTAIYVTLDGTTATTLSPGYNGPISVTGSATIQAIAAAPGYLASTPVTAAYTITTPPTAVISTVAGNGTYGFSGNGGPATGAEIGYAQGLALDSAGNLYFSDSGNNVVWMVSAKTGAISIVAGNGTSGYSGDNGLATNAQLNSPNGVAVDSAGNIYIADSNNNIVREVTASTGVITTIAGAYGRTSCGAGPSGQNGDGNLATAACLAQPSGLAFDSGGNLYIADSAHYAIRKVSAISGIITTIAGNNGQNYYSGDGGPATSAGLGTINALALDSAGNLFISSLGTSRIRKVTVGTGIIATVAGNGNYGGSSGDSGLAVNAEVNPYGIAVDSAGNLYISNWPSTVREVSASTGIISRVAGNAYYGRFSSNGDDGSATVAGIRNPQGLVFDTAGNLYIADEYDYRIRKVTFPGPAATPSFSPAAGTYVGTQSVAITDSMPGATIYYTTDGSTPTTGSNAYSGPVTVSATGTLQAIAVVTGYTESAPASAAYTINQPVTPTITWATPVAITYGTALSGTQLYASSSIPGSFVYTPAAGTVLTAGSQMLSVTFTPTDTVDYTTATATVTISVNQVTTSITWAAPAPVTYGTALGVAQLNASSSVAGSFVYTPAAGSVLTTGSQTLSVTFTPADATDYTTATSSVTLAVNKATPSITWAAPAAITYGAALGATQLNATSSVAGSFVYTPAAGTVLTAGSQTLSVTFTPTDTTDYTAATVSATLMVNKAAPSITWPTPAAITYGTALSATQLNATSSVPGSFAYTPAAGTVLTAGSQTLSVTFTPTDTTDYATATSDVTQVVNKAAPTVTWVTPAAITYGAALGATQLNATSSVAGSFVYTPAVGAVLTAGSQTLSTTFTPTDTTDYTAATSSVTLAVNKAAPAVGVTASSSSITMAQVLTVTVAVSGAGGASTPTGSVKLAAGSYSVQQALTAGSTTFNLAAGTLPVGSYTLTATYTPDSAGANNYTSASQTAPLTVTPPVGATTPTVTVTPTTATITNQQSDTVIVSVAGGSGQATPTGTVTLVSGSLNAQQTLASGTATFTIAAGTLSSGANTLTVSYSGDGNYGVASGTTSVTVAQATITLPAPASITPGANGTSTATISAGSTYSGTFDLVCSLTNSPSGAVSLPTCSLSPANVTIASGGSATTVFTVNTTAASTTALIKPTGSNLWRFGGGGAVLAAFLVFGIPSRRRRWITMTVLLMAVIGVGAIGCGGHGITGSSGSSTPATTAGNYTFTVTGTDSVNAKITTSTAVTVTVQ